MNTAIDSDDGNAALRDLARDAFVDWRRRIAAIIRQGIRDGDISKSTDPAELADTIIASLEGALMLARLDGNKRALKHVRQSMELLLTAHSA